jgi:hypothetical protein
MDADAADVNTEIVGGFTTEDQGLEIGVEVALGDGHRPSGRLKISESAEWSDVLELVGPLTSNDLTALSEILTVAAWRLRELEREHELVGGGDEDPVATPI